MLGLGQKGTFPLREKCPYLELFLSAFTCIRTEYGEILRISPYSVRMRENEEQNNSEYGHFLLSGVVVHEGYTSAGILLRKFTFVTVTIC